MGVRAEMFRAVDAAASLYQAGYLTRGPFDRSRWSCSTKDQFVAKATAPVSAASPVRENKKGRCRASRAGRRAGDPLVASLNDEAVPDRRTLRGSTCSRGRSRRDRSQLEPGKAQTRRRARARRMLRRSNSSYAFGTKLPSQLEHVKGRLSGRWKNATPRACELQGTGKWSS